MDRGIPRVIRKAPSTAESQLEQDFQLQVGTPRRLAYNISWHAYTCQIMSCLLQLCARSVGDSSSVSSSHHHAHCRANNSSRAQGKCFHCWETTAMLRPSFGMSQQSTGLQPQKASAPKEEQQATAGTQWWLSYRPPGLAWCSSACLKGKRPPQPAFPASMQLPLSRRLMVCP